MALLQIENLSFLYPNASVKALDNVFLTVKEAEIVVICGVSGCGKSTLLRHLKPELAPHGQKSGAIYYTGKLLEKLSLHTAASDIGFVRQSPDSQIVTDIVWHELAFGLENLGLSTSEIRRKVAEMAGYFGIDGWFRKPVAELSGGQKQLLNLAAVMAMQPRVLILDEPTAQLDPISAQEFLDIIRRINRDLGVTVLMSEHRLEEAFPMADQVVVMDKGLILQAGKPAEIVQLLESEDRHIMSKGLPSPVRIYNAIRKGSCPLTVREGRNWLSELILSGERHQARGLKSKSESKLESKSENELESEFESELDGKLVERRKKDQGIIKDQGIEKDQEKIENKNQEAGRGKPAVEVRQIWFRYERDGNDILRGLSLQAYPSQVLGVLGGNGTGKSTLLRVIAGLLKPYRGQVLISGRRITEYKAGELYRNNLVFLPQDPRALFVHDTVRKDLEETAALLSPYQEALFKEIAGIAPKLGIEDLLSRHPYDLSGGEQQKVALAKLLLLKPRVILLDEPTKGLDACSKEVLGQIFKDLCRQGAAVIMVSHDLEFAAEHADTCTMIFDGDSISTGTAREFFAGNSFYTTAANRMVRGLFPQAVTCKDVIEQCLNITDY